MNGNGVLPDSAEAGKCYARCLVPNEYEAMTRQIQIKKGYQGDGIAYITTKEPIMVAPARRRWKRHTGTTNCMSAHPEGCEIWCLNESPAQYDTIVKQLLVNPYQVHPDKLERLPELDEYTNVTFKHLIREGNFTDWVEILCP